MAPLTHIYHLHPVISGYFVSAPWPPQGPQGLCSLLFRTSAPGHFIETVLPALRGQGKGFCAASLCKDYGDTLLPRPQDGAPPPQPSSASERTPNNSVQNSLLYFILLFFFVRQTH